MKLPRLTEAQVRELASGWSFERGETYYRDGAVLEPVRQSLELHARCEGSDYEPYRVGATLNESGVAETSCTCPYDYGGACKHVIALLLTYVHEPQAFRPVAPLATLLAGRSLEELIALVGELIKREPGLLSFVELYAETGRAARGRARDATRGRSGRH